MRGGAHDATIAATTTTAMRRRDSANDKADNTISLHDVIECDCPRPELAEDGVPTVQVRLWRMRDEPLAAAGIRARKRHAECAAAVPVSIDLVTDGMPRSAVAVPSRVAGLNDEIRHDAVEALSVEVLAVGERDEGEHGERRIPGGQREGDRGGWEELGGTTRYG